MKEVYFIVNEESDLYEVYFEFLDGRKKAIDVFNKLKEKWGIETTKFKLSQGKRNLFQG